MTEINGMECTTQHWTEMAYETGEIEIEKKIVSTAIDITVQKKNRIRKCIVSYGGDNIYFYM